MEKTVPQQSTPMGNLLFNNVVMKTAMNDLNPCLRCHKEIIRCSIYIELTANFRVRETHLSYSFICAFDDNTNLS